LETRYPSIAGSSRKWTLAEVKEDKITETHKYDSSSDEEDKEEEDEEGLLIQGEEVR
jgi:hypothetical protein